MKRIIFQISILLAVINLQAQNLVPNPSFEAYSDVNPQFCNCGALSNAWNDPFTPWRLTPPWYSPSSGSPDCFKPCSPDWKYQVPKNLFGFQYPRSGIGYTLVGCKTYPPDYWQDFREYLQVRLNSPLQENKQYNIEFFVSCIDSTNYAIDRIGMYISDTIVWLAYSDYHVLPFVPQISNPEYNFITDTANWVKISGIYTAHGGEQYITIGNFYDDNNTHQILIDTSLSGLPASAFYIDDVSVIAIEEPVPDKENVVYLPNVFSPNGDGKNDLFYARGENISQLNLKVYNRWGELVFESKDINAGWDGKYKGKECAEGVYFYVAEVTFANGETAVKKGNVTLIR
jgi:gliding motility-associated-like protein